MALADILMLGRMLPLVEEQLASHFTVHQVGREAAATLADDIAGRVRAVAGGAHVPVDAALLDRLPALEIVANFGVGYDSVDARLCAARGICVTNTPDVLTDEVADTAMGLLIMTVREFGAAERYLRAGHWAGRGPYPLTPASLRGRTLGILGLGRIGKAIATRAEAFGMAVHYHGRRRQEDVGYVYHDTLVGMAEAVDTLMVVAPGGAETERLVDTRVLAALGPQGIVVNVGRGTVIDEPALIEALQRRTILSAGLDVFEREPHVPEALPAMERVVLLPHVGSASQLTRNRMGQLVVDNLLGWFREGRPLTPVAETPFTRAARA